MQGLRQTGDASAYSQSAVQRASLRSGFRHRLTLSRTPGRRLLGTEHSEGIRTQVPSRRRPTSLLILEPLPQPGPRRRRILQPPARRARALPDLDRMAAEAVDDAKAVLVGDVVAEEHRNAAGERRPLSSNTRPWCRAAKLRMPPAAGLSEVTGKRWRWRVPFASRRSAPCCPAAARMSGEKSWSMRESERPLMSATAPPHAFLSLPRRMISGSPGSTASGVSAISSSVPSRSRKNAQLRSNGGISFRARPSAVAPPVRAPSPGCGGACARRRSACARPSGRR